MKGTVVLPPRPFETKYILLLYFTDDWKSDQYRWVNQGVRKLPKKSPKVKKTYFQVDNPKGASSEFCRHAYELVPYNNFVLIHYLGDENAATDFPHGNRKHDSRKHVRTCPSLLSDLKAQCQSATTSKVYKSSIPKLPPTPHIPVLQPRDSKQVENVRTKILQEQRISHDTLYNLHELAIDMPDFIHQIKTFPDLVCVCGQKAMLQELDRVLLVKSPSPQLLSYDTTFQLGDFYVSVLSFRHTLFKETPVIPAAFLIHERKFQPHHEEFLATCTKLAHSLRKCSYPVITDEERGIVNAITSTLPAAIRLRCWNHIFQDVTRWLCSHGAKSEEISIYLTDVRDLFHQASEVEYREMLKKIRQKWSAPFHEYYTNEIAPDITSIARWVIEPYGVYDPYSGITNNQAEGLNFVLKQLQEWREAPIDCMALALHHLQSYYLVEIARGQHGMGNYHLHSQYLQLRELTPIPTSSFSPDEIVSRIRGKLAHSTEQEQTPKVHLSNSKHDPGTQFSRVERARLIVDQNRINLDTKLHTFTVLGSEKAS